MKTGRKKRKGVCDGLLLYREERRNHSYFVKVYFTLEGKKRKRAWEKIGERRGCVMVYLCTERVGEVVATGLWFAITGRSEEKNLLEIGKNRGKKGVV